MNLLDYVLLEVSIDGHNVLVNFSYRRLHVYSEPLVRLFLEFFEVGGVHYVLISSILLVFSGIILHVLLNTELGIHVFKFLFSGATAAIVSLAKRLLLEANFSEGIH